MSYAPKQHRKAPPARQHSRYDSMNSSTETTFGTPRYRNAMNSATTGPSYLRDQFHSLLATNPIGLDQEGQYVPDEELEKLLSHGTITDALGQEIDNPLVEYVLRMAPKTFATLQLVFRDPVERKRAMQAFRRSRFSDDELDSNDLAVCDSYDCTLSCPHHFPSPEPWDDGVLRQFENLRWHFLVPTFDDAVFEYEFNNQRLLPFKTKVELSTAGLGYFSEVNCVKMLADKRTLRQNPKTKEVIVAHKTLRPQPDVPTYDIAQEWYREAKAHKQLNGISDHLVRGIAAYRRVAKSKNNDTFHLVLEWADGGNLKSFMTSNSAAQLDGNVRRSRERLKMVLEQLFGLAEALECMHVGKSAQFTSVSEAILQESISAMTPIENPFFPWLKVQEADDEADSTGVDSVITTTTSNNEDEKLSVPRGGPVQRRLTSSSSEIWRHGDIKPENILRFINGNHYAWLGTLKLADLGRAQQHKLKTALRQTAEKERYRTRWYEPPDLSEDLQNHAQEKISRLFDVWSMGCVIFECVIWLLYGSEAVTVFQKTDLILNEQFAATPYWKRIGYAHYELTERASLWMEHILRQDNGKDSAIGDMVKLVRDKLLQVKLPPDSEKPQEGYRTNAKAMKEELKRILTKAILDKEYLFNAKEKLETFPLNTKRNNTIQKPYGKFGASLSPSDIMLYPNPGYKAQPRVYTDNLRGTWQYPDDYGFVEAKVAKLPVPSGLPKLCRGCSKIDIFSKSLTFVPKDVESNLDDNSCSLCAVVFEAIEKTGFQGQDQVDLVRKLDHFIVLGTDTKILRLCCTENETKEMPLGAPDLHEPSTSLMATDPFMSLPKAWLQECDSAHAHKCGQMDKSSRLPLRLVDIRTPNEPKIVDANELSRSGRDVRYVALSHKWGMMPEAALTKATNLKKRKRKIPPTELPRSFTNAIAVTKAIGCDYLWIDSLCINQGSGGDFAEQADSMQTIFSNAYCVIAASSAMGACEGFLKREPLPSVKLGNVFVSAVTNDFTRDVIQSPLNRRGWVLQERALARRTIFFTKTQMYWECGDGVRCETLRKLTHDEIGFLGDSNFPSKSIGQSSTRGEQIHLLYSLFEQYTSLEFSHKEDRSVAIQGLMDRLTTAFNTQSLAGLFESFWGRCLLWQRASNGPPLNRIPPGKHTIKMPPTWSWMAVDGPITFLRPTGGKVDWATDVILPFAKDNQDPFRQNTHQPGNTASNGTNGNLIQAAAFHFKAAGSRSKEQNLFYDDCREHIDGRAKCVIIATTKDRKEHYVLLISAATQTNTAATNERVGIGCLQERCIDRSSVVEVDIG